MIVELIDIPVMPLVRILANHPDPEERKKEEIACKSVVDGLMGASVMAISVDIDGLKGVSIPAKRKHGKKPEVKKAPAHKAGKS